MEGLACCDDDVASLDIRHRSNRVGDKGRQLCGIYGSAVQVPAMACLCPLSNNGEHLQSYINRLNCSNVLIADSKRTFSVSCSSATWFDNCQIGLLVQLANAGTGLTSLTLIFFLIPFRRSRKCTLCTYTNCKGLR